MKMKQTPNVKNLLIQLFFWILIPLLLTSCSIKEVEIKQVPIERQHLNMQEPAPLEPYKIKWYIVTPENAETVAKELKDNNYNIVIFGLSDDGYEKLSMNLADMRRYILEQRVIIKAYKDYYENIDEENTVIPSNSD